MRTRIVPTLALAALSLLAACSDGGVVNVQTQEEGSWTSPAFRESDYSTPNESGNDQTVGTRITTWFDVDFERKGSVLSYKRTYDSVATEGFHRHTLPPELAYRANLSVVQNGSDVKVLGVDRIPVDVLAKLPARRTAIRAFLTKDRYMEGYEPDLKDWWTVTHLLQGAVVPNTRLDSLKGRKLTRTVIDSVRAYAVEVAAGKDCLRYVVYYQRGEKLAGDQLALQALTASRSLDRAMVGYKYDTAFSKVAHTVWIEPGTGHLCREQEARSYSIRMKDTASGEVREFPAYSSHMTVYGKFD